MSSSLNPFRGTVTRWRQSGSFRDLAELCIEANEDLCGGEWTPPSEENAGLFWGTGWSISGGKAASCEA